MDELGDLARVAAYIREHGGEVCGLTPEKLWDRAELIDDPDRPGWIVFEVERHSGILGSVWTPGEPMEAFVTYWERLAFHPERKVLECVEGAPKASVEIDYDQVAERWAEILFDFTFKPAADGKWCCQEVVTNEERLVGGVEEAEAFAAEQAANVSFESEIDELKEYCEPDEVEQHISELRKAYKKQAIEKVRWAWQLYAEEGNA